MHWKTKHPSKERVEMWTRVVLSGAVIMHVLMDIAESVKLWMFHRTMTSVVRLVHAAVARSVDWLMTNVRSAMWVSG